MYTGGLDETHELRYYLGTMPSRHKLGRKRVRAAEAVKREAAARLRRKKKAIRAAKAADETKEKNA